MGTALVKNGVLTRVSRRIIKVFHRVCQRTIVMYKHWPSRKDRVSSVADLVHRITGLRYIREFSLCIMHSDAEFKIRKIQY